MSERETNNEIFVLNSINRSITQDDGQVNLKEVKKELKSKSEKEVSMNRRKRDARRDLILENSCSHSRIERIFQNESSVRFTNSLRVTLENS